MSQKDQSISLQSTAMQHPPHPAIIVGLLLGPLVFGGFLIGSFLLPQPWSFGLCFTLLFGAILGGGIVRVTRDAQSMNHHLHTQGYTPHSVSSLKQTTVSTAMGGFVLDVLVVVWVFDPLTLPALIGGGGLVGVTGYVIMWSYRHALDTLFAGLSREMTIERGVPGVGRTMLFVSERACNEYVSKRLWEVDPAVTPPAAYQ